MSILYGEVLPDSILIFSLRVTETEHPTIAAKAAVQMLARPKCGENRFLFDELSHSVNCLMRSARANLRFSAVTV